MGPFDFPFDVHGLLTMDFDSLPVNLSTIVLFQVKGSASVESVTNHHPHHHHWKANLCMLKPFLFYRLNHHYFCVVSHILPMCFHISQNNNLLKNMFFAGISITWLNHILFYLQESNTCMKTSSDNKHHFFINNMFFTCCHIFLFSQNEQILLLFRLEIRFI